MGSRPQHTIGLLGLALASLTMLSSSVSASPLDVFGLGARATAMGGAQVATAQDHAAVYYNPALLTVRKKTHVGLTLQFVAPNLSIDRLPGSSERADGGRDTALPQNNLDLTAGLVFPVGGLIDDRFAVGFVAVLPLLHSTRLAAHDPATPQLPMYEAQADQLVMIPALAFEVFDELSVGAGAQVLVALSGRTDASFDTATRRVERRDLRTELDSTTAPVLGLSWRPSASLSVGLGYRGALALEYRLPIVFDFDDIGVLAIDMSGQSLYTPAQLVCGVAYDFAGLTLAFDLTYQRWSAAPPPSAEIVAHFDDSGFVEDDPGSWLDFDTPDIDPGFRDTVVPSTGLEWQVTPKVALRVGYTLKVSPIPDQVGYTNFLDGTAHRAATGMSFTFRDPLEAIEAPVTLDLFAQATLMERRRADKIPARDPLGIGSSVARGEVFNVGGELGYDF